MKQILYFTKRIHHFSGRILYLNLLGMIFVSLLESIGIFMIIPLISLTGIFEINSTDHFPLSLISDFFQSFSQTTSLLLIVGIYVLIMVGQSLFQRNQMIINMKIQQGFTRHLREETYKGLLQSNWSLFLNKRKSDLINIMTTEVGKVSVGTYLFLQFISSLVFTFIQILVAFWLSPKLTLFVLFFGFALIFFSKKFIKKSNDIGKETIQLSKTYLAGISDQLNGIKDIKSNNLEASYLIWFKSMCTRMEHNFVELTKLKSTSQFIYKFVSSILIGFFVFFAIQLFQAQPAQLMLIVIIFSRLWPRFTGIQSNLEQLGSTIPSFNTLIQLQQQCQQAKEFQTSTSNTLNVQNEISCKNVYFRYNTNASEYALKGVDIKIKGNRTTAIVGRSGAGKSTLIDLIMGLNLPEKGEVFIDDKALNGNAILELRNSISYVPQDPFLFNTSIRENMTLVKPNADDEQVWDALRFASADEFVKKLPQGLGTIIGDRGIRLSGGERQRIVLARAILRNPSILVLDEATSALDLENETKIQEAIDRLKGRMTIIVIAHRLSTIRNADQVIVLDEGRIMQNGEFHQLANDSNGMFSYLLGKQMTVS